MNLYIARRKDALTIARLHKKEIAFGFLSSLPLPFLQTLYEALIESPFSFCVAIKENDEIVGFASGATDLNAFYKYFISRHFFRSAIILLPKVFSSLKKMLETFLYPKKGELLPKAELLTIAVSSQYQGKGHGKILLDEIINQMKQRYVKTFKLIVGEDLKHAIRFYEKNGFVFLKEIMIHGGHVSKVYVYYVR